MKLKNNNWLWPLISVSLFIILITLIISPWSMMWSHHKGHDIDTGNHSNMKSIASEIQEKQSYIITSNRDVGKYSCCLEKPCIYCINKSSKKHGAGTSCECLDDIMNGRHPCGECIGEILEGHGNKYLAQYFASSISDEVGMKYLPYLKQIISDKYEVSIEEQI